MPPDSPRSSGPSFTWPLAMYLHVMGEILSVTPASKLNDNPAELTYDTESGNQTGTHWWRVNTAVLSPLCQPCCPNSSIEILVIVFTHKI